MALDRLHLRKIRRQRKHTREGMALAARLFPVARDLHYGRTLAQRQKLNGRLHPYQRAVIAGILVTDRTAQKNRALTLGFDTSDGYYAKERAAIKADMQAGRDPHTHAAARFHHIAPDAVTPEQRAAAKARNFNIVYCVDSFAECLNGGFKSGEVGVVMSMGAGKAKTTFKDKFLDPSQWKNNMVQPAHPGTKLVTANFEELEKRVIGVDFAKEGDYGRTVIVNAEERTRMYDEFFAQSPGKPFITRGSQGDTAVPDTDDNHRPEPKP